jgi:hypothetical protein
LRHITNNIKNGQTNDENTFVGVNERAIYTIDTRLNTAFKKAQEKIYKTNPLFN